MNYELVKTKDYLLAIDDGRVNKESVIFFENGTTKRVVAHLPLNNALALENIDLLPPLEDDDEALAIIQYLSRYPTEFDVQIGICSRWLAEDCDKDCCGKPEKIITTTNAQGQRVWVGKYK